MSLDTVLQIGKVLRSSENSLKYFKYVEPCPKDNKTGEWPICITIPVNPDFTFDWNGMKITPPVKRDKLFYLKFSTSNSDTSAKKYGWGDIYYSRQSKFNKEGKVSYNEFGNYTFNKENNAFQNGEEIFNEIKEEYLRKIISPIIEIESENEKEAVQKNALLQLRKKKEGKEASEIPKNVQKYLNSINLFIQKAEEIENRYSLFQFQNQFRDQMAKFDRLLKYAPAIDYALQDHSISIHDLLQDEIKLKSLYCKVVLQNDFERAKKLFKKGEKPDKLTDETVRRIEQFSDFKLFVHFDFNGKSWHKFESAFQLIKNKLNSEITDVSIITNKDLDDRKVIVPSKNIYRTLCSGNKKNDWQFPDFELDSRYKSFTFKDGEQFEDFLHTDRFSLKKPLLKIDGTDIGVYILPVSIEKEESITPQEYESFFFDKKDENRLMNEPFFHLKET